MFLVQLIDLPRRASIVEAPAIAGVLAAPMHAIMAKAESSCTFCAHSSTIVPVSLQCRAASLRLALTIGGLDGYAARLAHARELDDALHSSGAHVDT